MQMMKSMWNAHVRTGLLIGIISGMTWGLNDVLANLYSTSLGSVLLLGMIFFSLTLSAFQDGISSLLLLSYWGSKGLNKQYWGEMRPCLWLLLISALFSGPLGMASGIVGIAYAGPVYAGVVTSCYPIIALILSILFLKESTHVWKVLGILLSVLAVIMIAVEGAQSHIQNFYLGMGFAFMAMLGWGMESVIFSYINARVVLPSSWILAIRQLSAACYSIVILLCLLCGHWVDILIFKKLFAPMGNIWMIGCIVTAMLSYLFYYMTIKRIGASMGTVFNATFVFWAALISIAIGLSQLTGLFWIWSFILVLGIVLSCTFQRN